MTDTTDTPEPEQPAEELTEETFADGGEDADAGDDEAADENGG